MKLLTLFLFGIIISGSLSPAEQKIVTKYSPFYAGEIKVNIVKNITHNCSLEKQILVSGCYFRTNYIEIADWNKGKEFERVLVHELTHWKYPKGGEVETARRTKNMIDFIGSIL